MRVRVATLGILVALLATTGPADAASGRAGPSGGVRWPTADRYLAAAKDLPRRFLDRRLMGARVVQDPATGKAWSSSGNYATTFLLQKPTGVSALRLFHPGETAPERADPRALGRRYGRLGAYLARAEQRGQSLGGIVGFRYLPEAIHVDGRAVPGLEMNYVDGDRIDHFAYDAVQRGDRRTLGDAATRFRRTMKDLGALRIAHGDLHPGNIRMGRGGLQLIDYDAMYAPPLEGLSSSEIGSEDYQHPAYHAGAQHRPFDAKMDRFSSLTIYLSLRALQSDPSLWARHHDSTSKGWGMLFSAPRDFRNPAQSRLFNELRRSPDREVRYLADALYHYVQRPPRETPALESLITRAQRW